MKRLHYILIVALLFSFIGCSKSLKNNEYYFPPGQAELWSTYSLMQWKGIFNPKTEFISVKFIDDTNALYHVLTNNGSLIIETNHIKYTYDKDYESGYLILSNKRNRKLPFKTKNNNKTLYLSSSEKGDDVGIFLYKN